MQSSLTWLRERVNMAIHRLQPFVSYAVFVQLLTGVLAQQCSNTKLIPNYADVFQPELQRSHGSFLDLPGFTRSRYRMDHALITPESRVWLPNPTWPSCKTSHLISAGSGAHFSMFLARMQSGGGPRHEISHKYGEAVPFQRFVLVLSGAVEISRPDAATVTLGPNYYAFFPSDSEYQLSAAADGAGLLVYERLVEDLNLPEQELLYGEVEQMPLLDTGDEMFALRKLLPETAEYLFNIHIMDFQPGEHLKVHEVHYNQHGLLMLQGQGIYRLADEWYPVQAGDAIYMAPFVPQWYGALGPTPTRYVIYKDVTIDPLLG